MLNLYFVLTVIIMTAVSVVLTGAGAGTGEEIGAAVIQAGMMIYNRE